MHLSRKWRKGIRVRTLFTTMKRVGGRAHDAWKSNTNKICSILASRALSRSESRSFSLTQQSWKLNCNDSVIVHPMNGGSLAYNHDVIHVTVVM